MDCPTYFISIIFLRFQEYKFTGKEIFPGGKDQMCYILFIEMAWFMVWEQLFVWFIHLTHCVLQKLTDYMKQYNDERSSLIHKNLFFKYITVAKKLVSSARYMVIKANRPQIKAAIIDYKTYCHTYLLQGFLLTFLWLKQEVKF